MRTGLLQVRPDLRKPCATPHPLSAFRNPAPRHRMRKTAYRGRGGRRQGVRSRAAHRRGLSPPSSPPDPNARKQHSQRPSTSEPRRASGNPQTSMGLARGRLRGWYLGRREEHGRAQRLGSLLQIDAEHLRPRDERQQRQQLLTRRDALRTQPTKPTCVETKVNSIQQGWSPRGGAGSGVRPSRC